MDQQMRPKNRSLPKKLVDDIYNRNAKSPVLSPEQMKRFIEIRAILSDEIRNKKTLKTYRFFSSSPGYSTTMLKDPVMVTMGELPSELQYRCILTGENVSADKAFVAFISKRLKRGGDYAVTAVVKDKRHLPLLLYFGDFESTKASLTSGKPKTSSDEDEEIRLAREKFLLLADRKFCTVCGSLINPECSNLKELGAKRKCNRCKTNGSTLPKGFKCCRSCATIFLIDSPADVNCPKCNKK